MPSIASAVSAAEIEEARGRLAGLPLCAPLIECVGAPADRSVLLKLENLQPIGSFKLRPVGNAVLACSTAELAGGICTASTGNSALAVAWMARHLGIAATAVVPDNAPAAKLDKVRALGARIEQLTAAEWWRAIEAGDLGARNGRYIDAVRTPAALAGDATIAAEILEQAPDVEAILVPFGGGGLSCGIACALRAHRADVRVIACELDSAHPLKSARAAGSPVEVPHEAGFVSGVGFGSVLREMWPLARDLIDEVITVSLAEVACAVRNLAERQHVIAEGAGAVSVAAALSGRYTQRRVCAVVSGGNIDGDKLAAILAGRAPS
jgi:threonine dehydratase